MKPRNFYDEIADSWYNIRHWSLFQEELENLSERWDGGRLLNIGCAHGSDFLPMDGEKFQFYGLDVSKELLEKAKDYSSKFDFEPGLVTGDMKNLPFQRESMDYVICIASLHHLLEEKQRLRALEEIMRVLKKGGEAFITVWNRWHPKFILKDKTIERIWNYKGRKLTRKYYLYTYPELKRNLEDAGFKVIRLYPEKKHRLPIKYLSENILANVQKV